MSTDFADVERRFADAMRARTILPPRELITDGKFHRCDVDAKHGKNDASYFLHVDGIAAGGFENHRDGLGWQDWCSVDKGTLPPAERAAHDASIEAIRKARAVDEAKIKADARERAARLLNEAKPAPTSHQYLKDKKVKPHGLRVGQDGWLLVPFHDADGTLHTIQRIGPDGTKLFLKGGRKHGCFFSVGKLADNPERLDYAEGFATAASIHEAIGRPVIVTGDCGNMLPVAESLRKKYPRAALVFWADNDLTTPGNPGLSAASYAAKVTGGRVVLPGDFNDLGKDRGPEVVKTCGERVTLPTATPAAQEPAITLRLASDMVHDLFSKPLPPPIATPFPQLNLLLGGGLRGVNVLAGPTGRGKSGWALAQARLTARTRPVVYLSTELDERQALARVAAQELGKAWRALYEGDASTEAAVAGAVAGLRLYVLTIASVAQMLDTFAALALCETEPALVVLDYLQGLARTAEDRRLAVGCVSEGITAWTRTTGGVVLAVSSISRANYFGTDEKSATDFVNAAKESGDVEFDAASVMFLDVAAPPLGGTSEGRLHVAKSRFGSAGTIGLFFDGPSGTFQADPAGGLTADQRAVYEAIQDGARTWNEIGKAAELRRNKIGPCLRALQARNLTDGQNRPLTSAGPKPRQNGPINTTLPGTSSQSVPGGALVLPFPSVSTVPGPGTGAAAFPVSSPPYRGELGTADLGNRTDPGRDTL